MRIVVCIKQVPDTNEVRMDPKTNTLIREGVPSIINPDDRSAIEAGLVLREQAGGTVTALCMGPAQADVALRTALAMGCDEAVLVSGREFSGSDTLATSTILSAALRKIGFDLVLAGRQAIDGDTAQVGPQIAEHLGIPQLTYAEELQWEDGALLVRRQFEDRFHRLRVRPPCVITALSELATPRYMTVGGIVDAYTAEVTQLGFEDLKDLLDPSAIGLHGSPTNVVRTFVKQPGGKGTVRSGLNADEAVEVILEKLEELHII